jgi:pSer/pThr/pTyr-binding forkhead associated (FHA) protein
MSLPDFLLSRRHAALENSSGTIRVRDLKSRNGTFVNGVRIESETVLADGDLVRVGSSTLKVRIPVA